MTKTGDFIRLIQFIIDVPTKKEYTIYNKIHTENIFEDLTFLKKIINISRDIQIIETNHIDRICVFINTGDKEYICPVPNLYLYS